LDPPRDRHGQRRVNDVLACGAQHRGKRRQHLMVRTMAFG
jgi:hypothetical protein